MVTGGLERVGPADVQRGGAERLKHPDVVETFRLQERDSSQPPAAAASRCKPELAGLVSRSAQGSPSHQGLLQSGGSLTPQSKPWHLNLRLACNSISAGSTGCSGARQNSAQSSTDALQRPGDPTKQQHWGRRQREVHPLSLDTQTVSCCQRVRHADPSACWATLGPPSAPRTREPGKSVSRDPGPTTPRGEAGPREGGARAARHHKGPLGKARSPLRTHEPSRVKSTRIPRAQAEITSAQGRSPLPPLPLIWRGVTRAVSSRPGWEGPATTRAPCSTRGPSLCLLSLIS